MRNPLTRIALFVGLVCAPALAAESFKIIRAGDLATLMTADHKENLWIYDANPQSTREREGIVPGAKLLSSYNKFDVAKELPEKKDAKLVFYCANQQCMASHAAAKRAVDAGYQDVNVMSDGIMGWTAAGHPSAKP